MIHRRKLVTERLGVGAALLLFLLFGSGCAQMQSALVAEVCTPDAAYAAGVNDAKNGRDMQSNYSSGCPAPAGLNDSYRKGYQFGLSRTEPASPSSERAGYGCVSSFGREVCGYECKESLGSAQCASTPDQQCVVGPFGKIACGYSCVVSPFAARCAVHRGNNCVSDSAGNIQCGRNCRIDYGNPTCDSKEKQ
jgi:hypothetical protein